MKKYVKPSIGCVLFETHDVIATSGLSFDDYDYNGKWL